MQSIWEAKHGIYTLSHLENDRDVSVIRCLLLHTQLANAEIDT